MLRERAREVTRRGAALGGGAAADRRHDRDEARGQRRGDRGQPGRRDAADRGRRGRAGQPALPVQAAGAADGDREPGARAGRRRAGRDRRGLPVGARPARGGAALRGGAGALPRPRRRAARGGAARADGRHVPARGRPPRRGAVPRPRAGPDDVLDLGAATQHRARSRRAPARSWRGWARERCSGASSPGSAARQPSADVLLEIDGGPVRGGDAGRAAPTTPTGSPASRSPASPTRTRTPSSARCAGATHAGEGSFWTWREQMYELAGDARSRLLLRALARRVRRDGAGRDHVRRRVPLPPPRARRHALRGPERDGPRGARRRARRPGCGSRCSTPATCTAASTRFRDRDADRVGRARRRCSPSAGRRGSAPRSTACARSTRTPRAVVAEWAARQAAARARLRAAEGERGHARRARPHADRAARRRRRARRETSPRSTRRT